MENFHKQLALAIHAAVEAGKRIMNVYEGDLEIELKNDNSPLTLADRESHNEIVSRLETSGLPVLSEEGRNISYEERKGWKQFWLIDPLDGTKEFIKRNGEFTVNIALIHNGKPELGVIYVPATDILYFASPATGSYIKRQALKAVESLAGENTFINRLVTISHKLPVDYKGRKFTAVASRSHLSPETESFISELMKQHGNVSLISKGSSLKICLVAEGSADVYPRLAPTMEWDTAAGQAIAVNAGCSVLRYDNRSEVTYNKSDLLNPFFIVSRP
jgi:3'(2'), 5'-bisphosphate nucleotidase